MLLVFSGNLGTLFILVLYIGIENFGVHSFHILYKSLFFLNPIIRGVFFKSTWFYYIVLLVMCLYPLLSFILCLNLRTSCTLQQVLMFEHRRKVVVNVYSVVVFLFFKKLSSLTGIKLTDQIHDPQVVTYFVTYFASVEILKIENRFLENRDIISCSCYVMFL